MQAARLAVDIGGTFTDLALEHAGRRTTIKVLTTQAAPEQGVLDGVRSILATAQVSPAEIGIAIHGTTLATNAIIERKGARTALITTQGFRDVIAMGNESRYDQYDLNITLPEPLVPRHLRLVVPERLDNEGHVLLPLDEAAVHALVPALRDADVQSIAVGFLHAFVNPRHEQRVREILAEALPDVPVSLSSEVSPEMREWERFSTTVANAYVQPLMARYLRGLAAGFRSLGVTAPVFLMLSGGGLTTIETACRFPVRLVESGPAGGAIFSASIARECGLENVLSFDMGGTTAKICLIDDGKPQTSRSFEIARIGRFRKGSGLPLRIPVIEMVEIGAGGGSIARIDAMGRIAVGPDSAGSEPGPVCYARGGVEPTVTDADVVMGRIDPATFSGGSMSLDVAGAKHEIGSRLGERLGLSAELAALGVSEMVDENMANAARVHAIESGKDVRPRTLIAFGGAAPIHAARVAEKLGVARVLIPANAGVGSAVGFLRAPVAYEIVRSHLERVSSFNATTVNKLLGEMRTEAEAIVRRGAPEAKLVEHRSAFMRYRGQGHEIAVNLPVRAFTKDDGPHLTELFETAYRRLYARAIPGVDVEILSWVVSVSAPAEGTLATPVAIKRYEPKPRSHRKVFDPNTGEFMEVPIYWRPELTPGARIKGPAVIAESETSTVVSPIFDAEIDGFGYIALTRRKES